MTLKGRSLLTLADYTKQDITQILTTAKKLKGKYGTTLKNKVIGLLFQKPSTRTRVSFEVAVQQLGGSSLYLNWNDLQLGRKEPIKDTAIVLSRYVDGLVARLYSHKDLEEINEYANMPVINALTDLYHPCQALGDLLTIQEKKGDLYAQKIVFVGDGNNVSNSLLIAASILGLNATIISPKGYEPPLTVQNILSKNAANSGAKITITTDLNAIKDADVVYTDVWVSMGQEKEENERLNAFKNYKVDDSLLSKAASDCIFMHCLPRTPLEVT
ncbi:MAG: ornithine carbamoyltransferase, partial [Candidatus Odinarchaeia archaeon]